MGPSPHLSSSATKAEISRRGFMRTGGFAFGSLLGLGIDLEQARADVRHLKIKGGREVPTICPYCAVGCGQIVSADRDGHIVNIEGNPDSPINRGTLCPKGAATYQLAVNPLRATNVWYRAPGATEWDTTKTLDWAMDRIAQLVKKTRDETFQTQGQMDGADGRSVPKRVNHTLAIASLGGATMDNEWNYLQCKLMRSLGVVFLENQARI